MPRHAGLIPAYAVLGVTLITATAVLCGPPSHVRTESATLNQPDTALIEPADHIAMLGWFALAIALALSFAIRRRTRRTHALTSRSAGHLFPLAVAGVGLAAVIASVTWTTDAVKLFQGIPLAAVLAGTIGAVGLLRLPSAPDPFRRAGALVVASLAVAYVVPALIQIPSGLRDTYHFQFTADELAAVAAGRFPLSDYIPQYANLLGFPIAPVLHWFPAKAELIVLAWLLLLQVIALATAVALPVLLGGRRYLAAALIVACMPAVMTMSNGFSASTYFAGLPMRVILPSLTILAAFLAFRQRPHEPHRHPARFLGVGAIAGVAALNNPDFGVPVVVVVLVMGVLVGVRMREKLVVLGLLTAGASAVFPMYAAAAAAAGRSLHWADWLAFQRIFGVEGFADVAMPAFGLHIAVVGLFVSASVVGFVLIISARTGASSFAYRQGVLLGLTGGWSLLSLPYFAGRSLPPTLVVGYWYCVGMVVAALLPLLHMSLRAIRARIAADTQTATIGLAFGVLAVGSALATTALVWPPSDYVAKETAGASGRSAPLRTVIEELDSVLNAPGNASLRTLTAEGSVAQALWMPDLLQLTTGMPSLSATTSPRYYQLSPFFVGKLCGMPRPDQIHHLLVAGDVAVKIAANASCAATFDFDNVETFSAGDSVYVLLPYASSSP